MPNYEFIGKSQLSKGFSYPLKRSTLDAFLDERGIDHVTGVAYCGPDEDGRVLAGDHQGTWQPRQIIIWINAVPSPIRRYLAGRIESEFLANLAQWLLSFRDPANLASQTEHRWELYYTGMHNDGGCELDLRIDAPREHTQRGRFRAGIRHGPQGRH